MANESEEVIRHQMEETRSDLARKLETLEEKVAETVQGATSAVSETVETVKDVVQDTVETVKDVVHDTVSTVKESVQETVQAVKRTFDVSRQVDRHPWAMLGGSVALGFLVGRLLPKRSAAEPAPSPAPGTGGYPSGTPWPSGARNGGAARPFEEVPAKAAEPSGPGWLSGLLEKFGPEFAKLKGLAVGTILGVVRDMVSKAAPEQLKQQIEEVVNGITSKLGGEVIQGPVLEGSREASSSRPGDGQEGPGRWESPATVGASARR